MKSRIEQHYQSLVERLAVILFPFFQAPRDLVRHLRVIRRFCQMLLIYRFLFSDIQRVNNPYQHQ